MQRTFQADLFTPPRPSFHNSVGLEGEKLEDKEVAAQSLEAKVLKLFLDKPSHGMTAGFTKADLALMFGQQYATESYGRALTNLSQGREPKIYKSDDKRPGLRGIFNSVYKLKQ